MNGLPREHTIIFSRAGHCHDGWYERHLSCGKQRSLDPSEDFAWDSQVSQFMHQQQFNNGGHSHNYGAMFVILYVYPFCRDFVVSVRHTKRKSGDPKESVLVALRTGLSIGSPLGTLHITLERG